MKRHAAYLHAAYFLVAGLCAIQLPLFAQERDPTAPPPEVGAAAAGGVAQQPWGAEGMAVVVRDGKPLLVVDTRLYGVGQKVGSFHIMRITESEVWLREGKVVRKVPRFSGIQRSDVAVKPQDAASAPQSKGSKASTMIKKAKAP